MPRARHARYAIARAFCIVPFALAAPAVLASAPAGSAAAQAAPKPLVEIDTRKFPIPPQLVDNIDFWTMVYSRYTSDQVLLHDELHMHVIYALLDFSKLDEEEVNPVRQEQIRRQQIREATEKYKSILLQLASGKVSDQWPEDAARVKEFFAKVPGGAEKFRAAAERLRTQTCLHDRFGEGLVRSGYYMPEIERIFKEKGLPIELTRLPFVESLFQWNARSSVAAGGIWQFMPSTGRLFGLRAQAEYDDRFDPLRATHAAARLLTDNYKALGTWPLAVTAYNHGQGGMRRAVKTTGTTDMGLIATRYTGRAFGFASRNFYAELIAAARVYANRDHYFPEITPAPPLQFDELTLGHYVKATDLAHNAKIELDQLRDLNPAVSKAVWEGRMRLPTGYRLKVPKGSLPVMTAAYGAIPAEAKKAQQGGSRHVVRSGDTLGKIAARYGTTVQALSSANRLASAHRLSVGQVLVVPGGDDAPAKAAAPPAQSRIASQATAEPAPAAPRAESAEKKKHVVRRGDTLSAIAQRYGVSVDALRRANRLRGHMIQPAQVLVIP